MDCPNCKVEMTRCADSVGDEYECPKCKLFYNDTPSTGQRYKRIPWDDYVEQIQRAMKNGIMGNQQAKHLLITHQMRDGVSFIDAERKALEIVYPLEEKDKIPGELEIDAARGVIYFHSSIGDTILRICRLPRPIPLGRQLDITHMHGCDW